MKSAVKRKTRAESSSAALYLFTVVRESVEPAPLLCLISSSKFSSDMVSTLFLFIFFIDHAYKAYNRSNVQYINKA